MLVASFACPGFVSAGQAQADVMRKYLRTLQPGSTIKIRIQKQGTLKAVLLTVEDEAITVQPKTRVPEPVRTVPFTAIERVELDQGGGGIGKAIAIGAAAGAGAALGVLLILAAIFAD